MTPEELLDTFSIDRDSTGAVMFCALVYNMADYPDGRPGLDGPHAVAEVCKAAHMPRPAVYARMKKTLAPVFEAGPETLKALGLKPENTTVGLARALLATMQRGR